MTKTPSSARPCRSANEVVELGDVRKGVRRGDGARVAPALDDLAGRLRVEEADETVDAVVLRELGKVASRIDRQRAHTVSQEALQERSVVRADVDDEIVAPEAAAPRHNVAQLVQVRAQRVRRGRHVEVVVEHRARRDALGELYVMTVVAEADAKREARLRLVELLLRAELVRERSRAEVEELLDVRCVAEDAASGLRSSVCHWSEVT